MDYLPEHIQQFFLIKNKQYMVLYFRKIRRSWLSFKRSTNILLHEIFDIR